MPFRTRGGDGGAVMFSSQTYVCVQVCLFVWVGTACIWYSYFYYAHYDYVALVCVCLTCDSLFVLVWVCLCLCLARTSNQTMFFKMSAAHLITSSWYSSMQCRHFFPTFSTDGSSCWKISALWCRHRMSAVEGWRVKQSQLQVFVWGVWETVVMHSWINLFGGSGANMLLEPRLQCTPHTIDSSLFIFCRQTNDS